VEHKGERRIAFRVWWGKLKEMVHMEDLGINGRVLLKWIIKNRMWGN